VKPGVLQEPLGFGIFPDFLEKKPNRKMQYFINQTNFELDPDF